MTRILPRKARAKDRCHPQVGPEGRGGPRQAPGAHQAPRRGRLFLAPAGCARLAPNFKGIPAGGGIAGTKGPQNDGPWSEGAAGVGEVFLPHQ